MNMHSSFDDRIDRIIIMISGPIYFTCLSLDLTHARLRKKKMQLQYWSWQMVYTACKYIFFSGYIS